MSIKKEDLKVGLFVTVGLVVLMISLLLVGADKVFFRSYTTLYTHFPQVQGLGVGSKVSLSGIPIGNVSQIDFTGDREKVIVTMDVESTYIKKITASSRTSIKTQGALGDKYIYLTPGHPEEPPLGEGSIVQSDQHKDLLDVIANRGPELVNIIDVINELHVLLKNINEGGRSSTISKNIAEASAELKLAIRDARATMSDLRGESGESQRLREAVTHLSNILEKIDSGEGTLGALVNNSTLHERLITLLGEKPRNKYLKPLIRKTIKVEDQGTDNQ